MTETHPSLASTQIVESLKWSEVLYVLHGIFGSGRNWASVIRRFARSRPGWAARLVDLRQHGSSQNFPAPHTLESAARDLWRLAQAEQESPSAILGHSFGGKVALTYARDHGEHLKQIWVIDSTPEARTPGGSAWGMLEIVRKLPSDFANRDELIDQLEAEGVNRPTAQWMATNLEQTDGRYRWRFALDAIEEMLRDFFEQDLFNVIEHPPGTAQIHFVKAQESTVLSEGAVERINALSGDGRVFLHHVEGGHWVNAENPEALLALMTRYL